MRIQTRGGLALPSVSFSFTLSELDEIRGIQFMHRDTSQSRARRIEADVVLALLLPAFRAARVNLTDK